jgi:hypothetical protein
MNPLDAAVGRYVARRHKVLSLEEARDLRLSYAAVRHRVDTGAWSTLHRGVYHVGAGIPTPLALYRAAVLSVGADAVLSHRSAAALWGLVAHGGPVHVTCPRKLDRDDLVAHWTRRPPTAITRHGIPATGLVWTLDDLRAGEELIRSAERLHGLDRRALRRKGGTFARGHLIGLFLSLVDDAGLEPPVTEYPLLGYEIDAAWPAIRLAVEIDDYETHDNRDAMDRDRARDRELTVAGWTPVRATYADLTDGRSRLAGQLVRLGVPGRRSG